MATHRAPTHATGPLKQTIPSPAHEIQHHALKGQPLSPIMITLYGVKEASESSVEQISAHYRSNITNGLCSEDVLGRRKIFGPNQFPEKEEDSLIKKYLDQFKEPMIALLLLSSTISLILREVDDAISIFLAVVIVSTVGFVQSHRSEKAVQELTKLVSPMCSCIREGMTHRIPASELVPGDLVMINTGDRVPADIRLVETNDLQADESSFTGENTPCSKHSHPVIGSTRTLEQKNIAFLGTLISNGNGKGIVINSAKNSAFGEILEMMMNEEPPESPLQKSLKTLSKQLTFYSLLVIVFVTALGVLQGRNFLGVFTVGVSLAVAAIPEGLPIVVTVTLALGVLRMSKKQCIVRRLPAVETLGCITTICCDKTGTLTQNEMTVKKCVTTGGVVATVSGIGYSDDGTVTVKDVAVRYGDYRDLDKLVEIGLVCNNCQIVDGPFNQIVGSPTEGSLLLLARKYESYRRREDFIRIFEIPFTSEQKCMAVVCVTPVSNCPTYFFKGAPEQLVAKCVQCLNADGSVRNVTDDDRRQFHKAISELERDGLRVLAMAYTTSQFPVSPSRVKNGEHPTLKIDNILDPHTLVGFVGIMDPPRSGVGEAVKRLRSGGISVKMITGDSKNTAISIAEKLHIFNPSDEVIGGDEITHATISELAKIVKRTSVFYRTTPKNKVDIIKALQYNGETVCMTGDGINDAVALRVSECGVCMGKSGTDVTKQACDILLVNDYFPTIISAIEEGKGIFYNICNFLRFQLSTSVAALSLITICTFANLPNPLNAMQFLWINILMDGPPAQSLGVEPVDKDIIQKPPRNVNAPIVTSSLAFKVLLNSSVIVSGVMYVFYNGLEDGNLTKRDITMTFTCFVFFDLFNALSSRSLTKSIFELGMFKNKPFLIAVGLSLLGQFLVIYWPFMQKVFQTEALTISDLFYLTIISSTVLIVDETRKLIARRRHPMVYSSQAEKHFGDVV